MRVAILGAGAIGCYIGGHWARAGVDVTLIGRQRILDAMSSAPLRLTGSGNCDVAPGTMLLAHAPSALTQADVIVVAAKSTGLDQVTGDIAGHATPGVPVISLMNGLSPARHLRSALPNHPVLAGMVPFNVVWRAPTHLHQSSAGTLSLERNPTTDALQELAKGSGVPVALHAPLEPLQYGKLLLNLINPINALSGLPLHQMLSQRGYRRIYAAVIEEALQVYAGTDTVWQKVGPFSPAIAARLLALPDWIFNATIMKMQKIDTTSMTSMAQDLQAGKATEIDVLNGEIVALAQTLPQKAPLNAALVRLIKAAEAEQSPPHLTAPALARELGL